MKTYTVNQLAKMAGVSVRMLHYYDEIGLLEPAFTGENRYRYYDKEELLRLQQILIHRELDIPLAEIAAILDARGFDRLKMLQQQRERLQEHLERYAGMVKTIDRTIAGLKGERAMKDAARVLPAAASRRSFRCIASPIVLAGKGAKTCRRDRA